METYIIILLCFASFIAGLIDAIAGGGGLIQTPIALILLPNSPIANLIGSLKVPAITGTSIAAVHYLKNVKMHWKPLLIMGLFSCVSAFFGSYLLTLVSNDFIKPLLLFILIILAIYTFLKKDFGNHKPKDISKSYFLILGSIISSLIGFYDGFIGPGTGSFLIVSFIVILGLDFLHASAHAKLINIASNMGSLCLFISKEKIIWIIAIPMAICNGIGGWIGAKLAIQKGNQLIRIFFLTVVIGTLIRLSYDIFIK
ncbi:sulfite exporter TauE/SafE family protein [Flavobacterium oreochromis]|uniref:sulfite exporter TauE/SafE family protein n=1 Tax=Flavobacterium oreochromis TaxID=2906078 RepID=UPI00385BB3D7